MNRSWNRDRKEAVFGFEGQSRNLPVGTKKTHKKFYTGLDSYRLLFLPIYSVLTANTVHCPD
jgi:hypothetical protein